MSYALHLLHSKSQLDNPDNAELLRGASILVVAPEFPLDQVREKTDARLIQSWNACKMFLGGPDNAFWKATQATLLGPKRITVGYRQIGDQRVPVALEGAPSFTYDSADWGGSPVDPGDPSPHVLIEPTLENAERYAEVINARHRESGANGIYMDDSWAHKPPRITKSAQDSGRWLGYVRHLFGNLDSFMVGVWTNCAADPAADWPRVCGEYPATSPREMAEATVAKGDDDNIYWYGAGLPGVWLEGRRLP
jgi:hypothetical protein